MMSKYTTVVNALKKVKDQILLNFCSIQFTLDFFGLCKESQKGSFVVTKTGVSSFETDPARVPKKFKVKIVNVDLKSIEVRENFRTEITSNLAIKLN